MIFNAPPGLFVEFKLASNRDATEDKAVVRMEGRDFGSRGVKGGRLGHGVSVEVVEEASLEDKRDVGRWRGGRVSVELAGSWEIVRARNRRVFIHKGSITA